MNVTEPFRSDTKGGRSYLRAPVPLHFPSDEELPEGGVHLELRTALYLVLRRELAGRAFVGSEQFLYWDPTDPKKCLAPDVMVRLEGPDRPLSNLKVWEGGAPQLAVEIASPFDRSEAQWQSKLERYRQSGVSEVVRFDPEDLGTPLRLWDRLGADLIERVLDGPPAFCCDTLGLYWCVQPDERLGQALRLARDPEGRELLLTPDERIAELEAELKRR
jgi:Uma2 family endonuclease